jgi:hypothetical protein
MFKGRVDFVARMRDGGIGFPQFHFISTQAGVEGVDIQKNGDEVCSTVHISSVATIDDGMSLARCTIEGALDRLAFFHGVAIEAARVTTSQFSPVNQLPGHHAIPGTAHSYAQGHAPNVVIGVSPDTLKQELEQTAPPGEANFGRLRSARLSIGPVEEFMHLYGILIDLFNDSQANVDAFVVSEEPGVPQTPDPRNGHHPRNETIYTRLRNEMAHKRAGTSVEATKNGMADQVGGLRNIVRKAIERQ